MVMQSRRAQGAVALMVVASFACLVAMSRGAGDLGAATAPRRSPGRSPTRAGTSPPTRARTSRTSSSTTPTAAWSRTRPSTATTTRSTAAPATRSTSRWSSPGRRSSSSTACRATRRRRRCSRSRRRPSTRRCDCYDFFAGGLALRAVEPADGLDEPSQIPDNGGDRVGLLHLGLRSLQPSLAVSVDDQLPRHGQQRPGRRHRELVARLRRRHVRRAGPGAPLRPRRSRTTIRRVPTAAATASLSGLCVITLTVTDSAGQSDSDVDRDGVRRSDARLTYAR